jgi:hypothetical protein
MVKVPAPFLIMDPEEPVITALVVVLAPKLKFPAPSRVRVLAPRLTIAAVLVPLMKVVPMFSAVVVLAFVQVWLELDASATVKGLLLLPLMVTLPELAVLVMPPAPIVILLAVVVVLVFDWMAKFWVCLKVMDLATAAVFKDMPVPVPPRAPVMWKNTSSAARGVTEPTFWLLVLLVQLTFEDQVALVLPSQKRSTAWAAGALRARVAKKRSGVFLSFIVGLLNE